jgi:competence protein ComEA
MAGPVSAGPEPGARSRAMALVLLLPFAGIAAQRACWPAETSSSSSTGWAGVENRGTIRVDRADSVAALVPPGMTSCIPKPGSVSILDRGCRPRPLPLAVKRVLGLRSDLNELRIDDFESLSGIGPRLARRILDARRARNGFQSENELEEVPGLGRSRIQALRAALAPAGP